MNLRSKLIATIAIFSIIITTVYAQPVVTPIGTSYPRDNWEIRGLNPFYLWTDTDGTGDWTATLEANVLRFASDTLPGFMTIENTSSLGIEMATPGGVGVAPGGGGSLADATYYFKVVASDGTGFTIGSAEVSCVISGGGGTGRCAVSWAAVPGASGYRIYSGATSNGQDRYASVGAVTAFNWDDNAIPGSHPNTAGTVPTATSAYVMRLTNTGLRFPDGSTQTVASGASNWASSATHIYNTNTGNVCIYNSAICQGLSRLHVITSGNKTDIFLDAYGNPATNQVPLFIARGSRGTFGSPQPVQANDTVGIFSVRPREAIGTFSSGDTASIVFSAAENFSGSAHGTDINFFTTSIGSTVNTLRMSLMSTGNLLVGPVSDTGQKLQVNGTTKSSVFCTGGGCTPSVSGAAFSTNNAFGFSSEKQQFALEVETTTPSSITLDGSDYTQLTTGANASYRNLRNLIIATVSGTVTCGSPSTVGTLTVKLKRNGVTLKTATVQCAGDGGSGAPETVPFTVTIPDIDDPGTCSPTCTLTYELTASGPVVAGFTAERRYGFISIYQIP